MSLEDENTTENQNDEIIEQNEEPDIAEDELDPSDGDNTDGESDDDQDDEVVVSIGDEPVEQSEEDDRKAPSWVKELRKSHREAQKRIRELEAQVQTKEQAEVHKPVSLGPKPRLEDYDYDTDRFDQAVSEWYERKIAVDQEQAKAKQAEEAQQQEWRQKLDQYERAKTSLKVRDYEDAEVMTQQLLNVTQQGIVLQGADNPALVVYALGKNPKKAKELAEIKDHVKFAFAIAKLEKDLKVTNKSKNIPQPERVVGGSGRISGAVNSNLAALKAEADKSGDYTKYFAEKRRIEKKKT